MIKNKFIVVSVLAGLFGLMVCFGPVAQAAAAEQTAIHFYGKVVDFDGVPIAGATVFAQVFDTGKAKASGKEVLKLTTDANGLYEITATGGSFAIRSIKKDGYRFIPSKGVKRHYRYTAANPEKIFTPDTGNPVVMRMQKKSPPAFIFCNSHKFKFGKKSKARTLDLIGLTLPEPDEQIAASVGRQATLKVSAAVTDDRCGYEVTFAAAGENDGVIESNDLLYEAPATGYLPQVTVTVPRTKKAVATETYIYVKAEDGATYARIDVSLLAGKGALIMTAESWTNIDDSRNLEYDDKFQRTELKRRIQNGQLVPSEHARGMRKAGGFPNARARRRTNKLKREQTEEAEGKTKTKRVKSSTK